jgi:hypothetical protein
MLGTLHARGDAASGECDLGTYELEAFAFGYRYAIMELAVLLYIVWNRPVWCGGMLLILIHLFSLLVGLPLSFGFPWSCIAWLRVAKAPAGAATLVRSVERLMSHVRLAKHLTRMP